MAGADHGWSCRARALRSVRTVGADPGGGHDHHRIDAGDRWLVRSRRPTRPVAQRGHPKTIRSRISHRRVRDMCHVLIIEDEPYIAMQIEDVLRAGGARSVTIATTETDAIAAAQARRPDFITSDVRLSDGTGPSAIKAIRAMFAVVPVTFVTAWPQACGDVGRAEVLQKPVTAAALLASFRRALPGC
ncbi:CheY-like chemotaxis protein [Sphingomonas endophytica]|uniref:CheY-like chemotaxis protein n=1 Tax=Sphingomonas endophytica TaxID=869719 RepID=A0A7X0JB20_9SPHN|nr:response regulator [Sphingomonas endophytica]MBB6504000.1 CheY-like chemotaxis protein [Sphingomonas endophytica]